jgi:hypothetical protein
VLEHQTYIYHTTTDGDLHCNKCGNHFKNTERVTRVLTNLGIEYFHNPKCLVAIDFVQDIANANK